MEHEDSPDYADEGSPGMGVRSYHDGKLDEGGHEKLTENERVAGEGAKNCRFFLLLLLMLLLDVSLQVITKRRKMRRYLQICGRRPAGLS